MNIKLQNLVPGPKYSGVLLDDESHNRLLSLFKDQIPADWKLFAHHMTINPFGLVPKELVGKPVTLKVTKFGKSEKAIAVWVSGYSGKTNNMFPHVTIAVNVSSGGKPKDSNQISQWTTVTENVPLTGTIQNL